MTHLQYMYYWKAAIGTTQGIGTLLREVFDRSKLQNSIWLPHISKHDPKLWTNNFYGIRVQWDINKI